MFARRSVQVLVAGSDRRHKWSSWDNGKRIKGSERFFAVGEHKGDWKDGMGVLDNDYGYGAERFFSNP